MYNYNTYNILYDIYKNSYFNTIIILRGNFREKKFY